MFGLDHIQRGDVFKLKAKVGTCVKSLISFPGNPFSLDYPCVFYFISFFNTSLLPGNREARLGALMCVLKGDLVLLPATTRRKGAVHGTREKPRLVKWSGAH